MQITCSECKKVYNADPNRIPSGVTGTKCKACGNSISLRPAEAQATPALKATPAAKAAVMQITCQYCSKIYNINPKSIPEGVSSIKCKACSHSITLKPKSAVPAPESVPAKTTGQNTDTREITCLYCGKKYSIKADKIPPGVTTTKCKACGRNLSLKPAAGLTSAFKEEISKKVTPLKSASASKDQKVSQIPIIANIEPSTPPVWRKPWALAAAAAVVLLCIGFFYTGSKITQMAKIKLSAENAAKENIAKKRQQTAAQKQHSEPAAEPEPFLAAKVDLPLLLDTIDQNIPEDKKNLKYTMTAGILKSFGLSEVQLYLYPHPKHIFLPVILAASHSDNSLEKQFAEAHYAQFFKRLPDGSYAIKKEAIPEAGQNNFPIDLYRLHFIKNTAVIAPQYLSQTFKGGEDALSQSQVAQMIAAIAGSRDLVLLSLRIPEDFSPDWQERIQGNPALQQNPQTAMIAAMGGGMLTQLSDSLKSVESLAIGFRVDDTNSRQLSYAQQFRKGVDGRKIYQQLKSGNRKIPNADGIVSKLIEILNDPRYHHNIGYQKNNLLTLEISWEKQHDNPFLTALSEAILGQMFAPSIDLLPSNGPITVQYTEPPQFFANIDVNNLRQMIPVAVQKSLLPGNYWELGDQPRMTLELGTVDVPNASLAQLTYEVLEVLTTDGTNVMRMGENQYQPKINPGSVSPGTIDINVKKGTPEETLGTAKIRFEIRMPASFKKIEFASANSPGTRRESEGVWVKLDRLEKDVAKITYRGGESAQLFAFDKTGRALASRESMSSSASVATRFQGEISTLVVVVVQEMLEYPFEVDVDLNGGRQLSASNQPGHPKK